ncbi:uncharacterized protein TNCV_4790381 [Trichonephila clavipes]|nr:uncharacterized protein TNCV_4790381 [Trichonephila clavipes]
MPPNTIQVYMEYSLVKSVGSKILWAESRVQGTGEYFPPLQFQAKIVEIGVVAIYRPFGNWKVGGSSTSRTTMLKKARATCITVKMEEIASEAASGTNSAREAARRLDLPSSVRNILRRILQLYPYKLQSCHELLPADTAQREAFAKCAFSKNET